ncbi:MAG: anaerobic ribonucleoside-triphosphate reductase activating protein [Deltaproteobacteria bacterium]|nr:anaerobic ribonucleoside-triphosphate reductase activating protein [Deltaproteobacteria bacterium]
MFIGGIQKSSLIDYPGKISCVFFLNGCNFDCPYCHNAALVKGGLDCSEAIEDQSVLSFLRYRIGFLEGVVISGGEPTLQKDLHCLCERVKDLGYPVKLDTNGSRPEELKMLIDDGLVDYVAMDIKTDPFHYDPTIHKDQPADDLFSSIRTIMESAPDYEFRTTCVKGIVDETVIQTIAKTIKGAKRYVLQPFQNKNVLHPEFFQDIDSHYRKEELLHLKTLAEPWVVECSVR